MVTSIVVDTVSNTLPVFLALATGIVALIGTALKWASSRTHPGRLLVLENEAAKANTDISNVIKTVQEHSGDIIKATTVAGQVVPGLNQAASDHSQQIADLQKQIADLTAKIALVTTAIPTTTSVATDTPKSA